MSSLFNCLSVRSLFFYAIILISAANGLRADEGEWRPIPSDDRALKDNPEYPGSSAMILYKRDYWDHVDKVRELHYQIKIFNQAGKSYADIEIPYNSKTQELKDEDISARTIYPDGTIAEFHGAIFDKTLIRTRKENLSAKTFSLPEIIDGSIVEYRYRIKTKKEEDFFYTWLVQEDLYIREAHLWFRPAMNSSFKIIERGGTQGTSFSKTNDDLFHVTLHDLAPFQDEVYSPPKITQQMRYYILYDFSAFGIRINMDHEIRTYAEEHVNDFIGIEKEVRKITDQLIDEQDTDEKKLRKLYSTVQERIRNLSYEEQYTKKERKQEKLKQRKSAKDVWNYGYGDASEIIYLFTALCRAAGFAADTISVVERETNLFDSGIPLTYQIDGELVVVSMGSEQVYLDPGTRFAPFGWIPWWKQKVRGLRLGKNYVTEMDIPLLEPERNTEEHHMIVELQPSGSASIQLTERYTGLQAVDFRNEFFDLSEEQKQSRIRERLNDFFDTAEIEEVHWKGLDSYDKAVEFSYKFNIPGCGVVLSTRLIVKPAIMTNKSPFPQWERKLPVYLPDSYVHNHTVEIVPPAGFEIEYLPEDRHFGNAIGEYQYQLRETDGLIKFQSNFVIHAAIVGVADYFNSKVFFDRIEADEQRFLLLRRQ